MLLLVEIFCHQRARSPANAGESKSLGESAQIRAKLEAMVTFIVVTLVCFDFMTFKPRPFEVELSVCLFMWGPG